MKICLISNLYPPTARGGAEVVVQKLAQELVAAGHSVSVITAAPWRAVLWGKETRNEQGVIVHRIFHWNIFFVLQSGRQNLLKRLMAQKISLFNLPFAWVIMRLIKKERPDIVHTHNLAGTSFLVPLFLRWHKIPHLHTAHDVQLVIPSGRLLVGEEYNWLNTGCPVRIFRAWQRLVWGNPKIVTAPSEWLLKYYRAHNFWPRARTQVVRHFFGAGENLKIEKKSTNDLTANLEREKFTLLYVGQVERAKGVLMITQIFSDLWNQGKAANAELLIVGTGSDLAAVSLAAAGCPAIHVVGHLPAVRVAQMNEMSDVILVPSLLYENSPNAVVEALAVGRPVAVSDVGGAAELIKQFNVGWVVAPNEAGWREQIIWLLKHSATVSKMKVGVNLPNATDEFLELYKRLI